MTHLDHDAQGGDYVKDGLAEYARSTGCRRYRWLNLNSSAMPSGEMKGRSQSTQAAPDVCSYLPAPRVLLVSVLVGVGFGVGDQYLGSLAALGSWTETLSLLSAPWLVLPFAIGCSQPRASRAAISGLVVTMSALAGYFLMIMGPFEGGQWNFTLREAHGLLLSNTLNIIGGLVTGPVYGFLGQRWRTRRAWMSAALVAGTLCLEPFALTATGRTFGGESTAVWRLEVVAGIALAVYFVIVGKAYRRHDSETAVP